MTDSQIPGAVAPPPQSGGRNNRGLLVGLAVAAVLAVAGAVVSLGNDNGTAEDPQPQTSTTLPSTTTSTPAPTPSDLQEVIAVVDQGWYISTAEDGGNLTGSMGMVIQNAGDRPLSRLHLEVLVFDENDSMSSRLPFILTLLRPGEQFGLGHDLPDVEDGVSRLELTFPVVGIGPPAGEPPDGSLTASPGVITIAEGRTLVTYSVTSTYIFDFAADASVIFRDGTGAIVGGSEGGSVRTSPSQAGEGSFDILGFEVSPDATVADVYIGPSTRSGFTDLYG